MEAQGTPVQIMSPTSPAPATGCLAPTVHMYLAPNGDVRACCRNWDRIGNVTTRSLAEIWRGTLRRSMVNSLGSGDFAGGCGQCGAEIATEGRDASYASTFDRFDHEYYLEAKGRNPWPARIEFNLSNACNLMCIQCDGFLSSMIRTHREGLPPMPKVYGDAFFKDLEMFIPHLDEAQFAGGEPFLARENFRVWDLVERLNPDLAMSVVTNATQWNKRIERVGSTLNMGYTFSIDGVTRETYEGIRINADFDSVMANIPRFVELAKARDTHCEINFCLMRQNYHEFGEVLLWAEERELGVNVCVVRAPTEACVAAMSGEELRVAAELLERQDEVIRPQLRYSQDVWANEVARVRSWADADPTTRRRLWWSEDWWKIERYPKKVPISSSLGLQTIDCHVDADMAGERARLEAWSTDGVVHEIQLDYDRDRDDDHRITAISPSLEQMLDTTSADVAGSPPGALTTFTQQQFGPIVGQEELDHSIARVEFEAVHDAVTFRSVALAQHDDKGALVSVTMLVAACETASVAASV